ncbi:MAG TPA: carbon-nitrogen hydrolase [Gammaproteobacteria bacterium]|nr:carbon-nitrogen hydrolase [Gammaproteobacteria bacterium]
MKNRLKVAIVQHACSTQLRENQKYLASAITQAAAQGSQLIVLPELHNYPYFCQSENECYFDLAEPIPGPSTQQLARLARNNQVVIVASLFEKRASGLYHNTAAVFESDGEIAGIYRKMHIPDDPGYYEKYYFAPGDTGFEPIQTSVGKLGVLICWDQWFPEAARLITLAGAELLIYPTAIGWDPESATKTQRIERDAWITIQRAHAIANGLPIVVANRCGQENDPEENSSGINFWGSSFVAGSQGEILVQADTSPTTLEVCINLRETEKTRRSWPFLRDRRVDAYFDLLKQYID